MSDIRFQANAVSALWAAKQAGKAPSGDIKDHPLAKALSDNQLTRKEYEQLKSLYLKENPSGDFEAFLLDSLNGKIDNVALTGISDAIKELSRKGSALSSVSFQLNDQNNGYKGIGAAMFQPNKELLEAVKQADQDGNGRIEGTEREKIKAALKGLGDDASLNMLATALDDGMTTLAYDPKKKTLSLYFADRPPSLSGQAQDVKFSGELVLEDIDGVNDLSRNDIKGTANGKVQISYPFLSEVIRDALNPNLPNMSGSALGMSGGFKFALQNERYDAQRGVYVVNATSTLSAGVSRFSGSYDIPIEIQIKHTPEGELHIQIPALDNVSVPGIRAAAWKLRDELLKRVASGVNGSVDQQNMGVKLHPHVKTVEGTYTNWYFAEERGPVSQRLVLQPSLELKLKNPLPRSDGQPPADMLLDLRADRNNTQARVDAKGITLQLNQVPVVGSSDLNSRQEAAPQRDRASDSARLELDYGLDINISKGGKLKQEAVIKSADFKLDIQADEMQDFAFIPQTETVLGKEGQAQMQLRGGLSVDENNRVRGSFSGKIAGTTSQSQGFSHFQTRLDTGKTDSQRISLAGTDLKYTQPAGQKGEVHQAELKAHTGEVVTGANQPTQISLQNAQGKAQIDLRVLEQLQAALKTGNAQLLQTLKSVGLSDESLEKLTRGSRKELGQLLKLDDFLPRLEKAMISLEAGQWNLNISREGYQVSGEDLRLQAESKASDAQAGQTGVSLDIKAEKVSGHSLLLPVNLEGLQSLQRQLQPPGSLQEKLLSRLKVAGLSESQVETLKSGDAQALEALLSDENLPTRVQSVLSDLELQLDQVQGEVKAVRADAETSLSANASFKAGQVRLDASENLITLEVLQGLQTRLKAGNTDAKALTEALQEAGMTPTQLNTLRSGNAEALAVLAKDPDLIGKLELLPVRNQLGLNLKQGAVTAQLDARETGGNALSVSASATGIEGRHATPGSSQLSAESLKAQADYQDGQGNRMHIETTLANSRFSKGADGKFTLEAPQAKSEAEVRLVLKDFALLVEAVGPQELKNLVDAGRREDLESALKTMGLTEQQMARTLSILWHPQVKALLGTSDFVEALKKSETLEIKVQAQTSLKVDNASGSTVIDAQGTGQMQGSVRTGSGQTVLSSEGQAQGLSVHVDQNGAQVNANTVSGETRGMRQNGESFAKISGSIQDLRSQWSDAKKSISTGKVEGQGQLDTVLDPETLTKMQDILKNFKDELQERLTSFGLSKQQLENLLRAFGQDQLSKLFSGADKEQIQSISQQLGISPEQLERITGLLHDQEFTQVLEEIYNFSGILEQARLQGKVNFSGEGVNWSEDDKKMVLGLRGLKADVHIESENQKGTTSLDIQATQSDTRRERTADQSQTTWGRTRIEAQARAQDKTGKQLSGQGTVSYEPGKVTTDSASDVSKLEFGKIEAQAQAQMSGPGIHSSQIGASTQIGSLTTVNQPGQEAELEITDLQTRGRIQIEGQGQSTDLKAGVNIAGIATSPEEVRLRQVQIDSEYTGSGTRQVKGSTQQDNGQVSLNAGVGDIRVGDDEVRIQNSRLDLSAQAQLQENGKRSANLSAQIRNGQMGDLRAQDGKVKVDQTQAELSATIKTPSSDIQLSGTPRMTGIQAQDGVVTAKDLQVDGIQGNVKIRMDKFRDMLKASPQALAVINQVAAQFGQKPGELFTNDAISLSLNKGQLRSSQGTEDALRNPKDFSGQLRVPGLKTAIGTADLDIHLKHLTLKSDEKAPPKVDLSGQARFTPQQPAFNQSINEMLKKQFAHWGLPNLNTSVEMVNGEFRVKIDRWFADGLVKADFEGDRMIIELDKVKLLRFISAKGLVTSKVASSLENNLIGVERNENRLSLSLNDLTQAILHKDNLQIRKVTLDPNNQFKIDFAYTESSEYNAGARTRQINQVETTLLRDASGKKRSKDKLEEMVEDLGSDTSRKLFQRASAAQLREMLEAVGNDYDNVLRKALETETAWRNYPVENRAIMAAYLASDKGFFEGVDNSEKRLIKALVSSLQGQEYQRFHQALSADELKRINEYAHAELQAAYRRMQGK
ncbi:MAG: hypothetical protein IV090_09645 [Candidatus Sericytochromatia bacterium]|nr:hypothetical protein [Candidatus Sericytochromatia bacterium]